MPRMGMSPQMNSAAMTRVGRTANRTNGSTFPNACFCRLELPYCPTIVLPCPFVRTVSGVRPREPWAA